MKKKIKLVIDDIEFWKKQTENIQPIKKNTKKIKFNKKQTTKQELKNITEYIEETPIEDPIPKKGIVPEKTIYDKKFARKQLNILRNKNYQKIDLHNLTIQEAFEELVNFIKINYINNQRRLLVITGKGAKNSSSIRSELMHWVMNAEIRKYIMHCSQADKNYGGSGAFFIILRKTN